jgi:hypothetical protein
MDRRRFLAGAIASAGTLRTERIDAQDAYPSRAITVINPFPPGGVSDTITRPLDAALEAVLKQPVILENKPGAAGAVGAQFVASAKPDGYTLLTHLVSISGFAAVDRLFGRPPKFTNDDFIPLARIVADPIVMIVNVDLPYKSLQELVDDAKANLQFIRPLRRLACPDGTAGQGGRQLADAALADQRRWPGRRRGARRQCQLLHVADVDRTPADQERQGAGAGGVQRYACQGPA